MFWTQVASGKSKTVAELALTPLHSNDIFTMSHWLHLVFWLARLILHLVASECWIDLHEQPWKNQSQNGIAPVAWFLHFEWYSNSFSCKSVWNCCCCTLFTKNIGQSTTNFEEIQVFLSLHAVLVVQFKVFEYQQLQ